MCLYTNNREPLIAKEDITCYKILHRTMFPNIYRTPIMRTQVIKFPCIKSILRAEGIQKVIRVPICSPVDVFEVSEGFIHTYKYMESALCWIKSESALYWIKSRDYVVFACTIPKGTRYYEDNNIYASEKIVINEIRYDTKKESKQNVIWGY